LNTSSRQIKRSVKNHYDNYSKYWKDFSREYIKKVGLCQKQDETCKGILTVAHVDQNTKNNTEENLLVLCRSHHIRLDQKYHVFSMSSNKKTDNSYLREKVNLRIESLNLIKKNEINVLEAFAGDGLIWDSVSKKTNKKINILKIELNEGKKGVYLKGKNEKFISLFDFKNYDIIDLDAYGIPFNQLEVIFEKKYKGIVHCTCIQSVLGKLPEKMLIKLGYTKTMIKKIPTLFNKNGLGKIENYLYLNGVKQIKGYFIDRKNYFYFKLN